MGNVVGSAAELEKRWLQAAASGDEAEVRRLAECQWVDLNVRDSRGLTALMMATANGHAGCLKLLLQLGAEVDAIDAVGWTAATHAAFKGQEKCLGLLVKGGAFMDARDFLGTTPAMRAAIGGHESCLRMLREHGADLHARDNLGITAATHATRKGNRACVSIINRSDESLAGTTLLSRHRSSCHRGKTQASCPSTFKLKLSADGAAPY